MEQRIRGLLEDCFKQYEIERQNDAKDLEIFANFCVFCFYKKDERFNFDLVHVGDKNDSGLDGIGIIIHDRLLDAETINELDNELHNNQTLKVEFIFTQVKSSNDFLRKEILDICEAVKDFFRKKPVRQRNSKVENKARLSRYLLEKWNTQIREKPKCSIYYITNARKEPSDAIKREIELQKNNLQETCEINFENVEIFTWGCDRLEKVYRSLSLQIETTVEILDFVDLVKAHPIENIKKAMSITLEFSEFRKILVDEEDKMSPFIFYDNVRGFLGENNETNFAIKETMISKYSTQFPILNNGITIIAKEVQQPTPSSIRITDYQIVNGCQTSYILFSCRHEKIDKVVIPIKIIETDNEKIRNFIIKATNSQTAVPKELLVALSEFPQRLEEFYRYQTTYIENKQKLYYERRPGQYNDLSNIKRKYIVSVWDQIKSFTSMFLDLPHLVVVHQRKQLIEKIPHEIFHEFHHPIVYYTSSLVDFYLEKIKVTKQEKYHILMLFKYIVNLNCPSCNENSNNNEKIENYCLEIIKIVQSINCQEVIEKCRKHILRCYEIKISDRDGVTDNIRLLQSKTFTDLLLKEIDAKNANTKKQKKQLKAQNKNQEIKEITISRKKKEKKDEDLPLLALLPNRQNPTQSISSNLSDFEEVKVPESLNQKTLAKRFGVDRSTISRRQTRTDFPEWSQRLDPDGIAWKYHEKTKLYLPIEN